MFYNSNNLMEKMYTTCFCIRNFWHSEQAVSFPLVFLFPVFTPFPLSYLGYHSTKKDLQVHTTELTLSALHTDNVRTNFNYKATKNTINE